MALMWGNLENGFEAIYKSLVDVAQRDPLLVDKEGKNKQHKDGWGFLNLTRDSLFVKRVVTPLTVNSEKPTVKKGVVILHARLAAPNEPMGILNVHPFHASDESYYVYLAHNGWFDKYQLSDNLGLRSVEKMNDTEVFLKYVMSFEGNLYSRLDNALKESKERGFLKGGSNIFALGIDRNNNEPSVYYHCDQSKEREFTEYNKLYKISNGEWSAVVSSSLTLSNFFPKEFQMGPLARSKLYVERLQL